MTYMTTGLTYNTDVLRALYNQKQSKDAEDIKKKVKNDLAKKISEQAIPAYEQSGDPTAVLLKLNQMLPSGNQAVAGPSGGIIVGKNEEETPEALPEISPEEEAKLIAQSFAGYQINQQMKQNQPINNQQQIVQSNEQSTQQINEQKPMSLLKKILIGGLKGFASETAPDLYTRELQKQELEQGGKLGIEMQKAGIDSMKEQQKVEVKRRDEFLKSMTEPMTSETAKSLSQVEMSLTGLDNITNLLQIKTDENGNVIVGNKGLLTDMNFLNKHRQELIKARDNFINKSLRRDSGAVIGKEEEKQFRKVYGFDIGIGAFMKNPEVIAKSLLESKDQLTRDRNRLSPNEELRSNFQSLQQQGFSVDEIYEAYRKRGVL